MVSGVVAVGHSLAVVPGFRGLGIGRSLAQGLLDHAVSLGLGAVYLFTCRAESYFRALGFAVVERAQVPEDVLNSMLSLCEQDVVGRGHVLHYPLSSMTERSSDHTDALAGVA
jgi:N-acetylglutamate synthase-like GNAT family acetyltransferase